MSTNVILVFEAVGFSRATYLIEDVDEKTLERLRIARNDFDQDWLAIWVMERKDKKELEFSTDIETPVLVVHSGFMVNKIDVEVGSEDGPPPQ